MSYWAEQPIHPSSKWEELQWGKPGMDQPAPGGPRHPAAIVTVLMNPRKRESGLEIGAYLSI